MFASFLVLSESFYPAFLTFARYFFFLSVVSYSTFQSPQILERGVGLSTLSDSELITQMLSQAPPRGEKAKPDWGARIRHLIEATPTAYSLVVLHEDKIYGVRDPFGNRPLCIGRLMPIGNTNGDDPS